MKMLAMLATAGVESPTLTALNRLLGFTDRLAAKGARAARRRMVSVDIYPLNVVRLSKGLDLPNAQDLRDSRDVPVDHRMCYDVLCWLLIQLHGEEVWPC